MQSHQANPRAVTAPSTSATAFPHAAPRNRNPQLFHPPELNALLNPSSLQSCS
jgi:hypothetical protein